MKMTKTEAADIIANELSVYFTKHGMDDSELSNYQIACAISRAVYQSTPGSYAHTAGLLRPADRTVRMAYRRNHGLLRPADRTIRMVYRRNAVPID